MSDTITSISVGTLVALLGLSISYIKHVRDKSLESFKRAGEFAKMQEQINSLRLEIEDVKLDMRSNESKIEKQLDRLDEKIDMLNQNLLKYFNTNNQ